MAKIQIRQGVFETNSSSVHSIAIVPADDYRRWQLDSNVYFRMDDKTFLEGREAREENVKYLEQWEYLSADDIQKKEAYLEGKIGLQEMISYHDSPFYMTYNEYIDLLSNEGYETYSESYRDIMAFGYFGHD